MQKNDESESPQQTEDSEQERLAEEAEQKRLAEEARKASLVWIDDTAAKYHQKNGCGMDNAYQVTLEEAKAMGKEPCGRCYK